VNRASKGGGEKGGKGRGEEKRKKDSRRIPELEFIDYPDSGRRGGYALKALRETNFALDVHGLHIGGGKKKGEKKRGSQRSTTFSSIRLPRTS